MNPRVSFWPNARLSPVMSAFIPLVAAQIAARMPMRRLQAQGACRARGQERHLMVERHPDVVGKRAGEGVHLARHVFRIGQEAVHGDQRRQGREHRQEGVEGDAAREHRRLVTPGRAPHPVGDPAPSAGAEEGQDPWVVPWVAPLAVQNAPPPAALNTNPRPTAP